MIKTLLALSMALAGAGALVVGVWAARPHRVTDTDLTSPPLPVGHEEPVPGATFLNGFNVVNLGPCAFQTRHAEAGALLGPPIGSFTGRSQDFQFGRLICVPGGRPGEQVKLDDLGLSQMRLRGLTPSPGAEPHPAVRSHLLEALETGLEPADIYGRVISPPLCDRMGHCRQYTDKQLLLFDDRPDAVVRWAPLGCLLNHACQAATTAASQALTAQANRALVIATSAVGLLGLAGGLGLLLRARAGQRYGGATI